MAVLEKQKTIFDTVKDYLISYLTTHYTNEQLCDIFNNRILYNDSLFVAKFIDDYFENDDFRFVDDLIAKIKVAFGREVTDDVILNKSKEYVDWAFSTNNEENVWCKKYIHVYDGMYGCLNEVDYIGYKCNYKDNSCYIERIV